MNIKRAIWMGLLVYVISFAIGTITAKAFGVDLGSASEVPAKVWYVGILATIVLVYLFTLWYFKLSKANAKEGFYLGLSFVIIGAILDIALIIPYILVSDSPADIMAYYAQPLFWLTLVIVLVTSTLTAKFKKN